MWSGYFWGDTPQNPGENPSVVTSGKATHTDPMCSNPQSRSPCKIFIPLKKFINSIPAATQNKNKWRSNPSHRFSPMGKPLVYHVREQAKGQPDSAQIQSNSFKFMLKNSIHHFTESATSHKPPHSLDCINQPQTNARNVQQQISILRKNWLTYLKALACFLQPPQKNGFF